jgi:hypothetical protein
MALGLMGAFVSPSYGGELVQFSPQEEERTSSLGSQEEQGEEWEAYEAANAECRAEISAFCTPFWLPDLSSLLPLGTHSLLGEVATLHQILEPAFASFSKKEKED